MWNCAKCAWCAKCATHPRCWPQNLQCGPAAPPYDQWKLPTSSERSSSPWSLPYLSTPPPYTCPKEERPNWDSWFILCKTCVLCATVDPTFIFWGKKLYSLLSDGVFTISVQTTTTIARRGIWTLNRHIWTYTLLLEQHQDHWSYIFETGAGWKMEIILCNILQSAPYIYSEAMRCWGW